jgi:hypothetical protein
MATQAKHHKIRYPKLYGHGRLQEHPLHVAQRFELFLDEYRRPDGTPGRARSSTRPREASWLAPTSPTFGRAA